jgi:heme/copper-type cytochrome/quinol oxidase subunit 2
LRRRAAGRSARRSPASSIRFATGGGNLHASRCWSSGICGAIFIIVGGLLVYSIIRFRHRPEDGDREPPQIYGSNPIEMAWTVVPLLIVFVLFLVTTRTLLAVQKAGTA